MNPLLIGTNAEQANYKAEQGLVGYADLQQWADEVNPLRVSIKWEVGTYHKPAYSGSSVLVEVPYLYDVAIREHIA